MVGGVIGVKYDWLARILSWDHIMEDSKSIPSHRVSMIIFKHTYSLVLRTNISVSRGSDSMNLEIIPKTVSVRASSMIANEVVVRVSDPEAGWSLISIKETPGSLSFHNKVSFYMIPPFDSIFNENGVTFCVEGKIVHKS